MGPSEVVCKEEPLPGCRKPSSSDCPSLFARIPVCYWRLPIIMTRHQTANQSVAQTCMREAGFETYGRLFADPAWPWF